jgi:hypothetical protein
MNRQTCGAANDLNRHMDISPVNFHRRGTEDKQTVDFLSCVSPIKRLPSQIFTNPTSPHPQPCFIPL